MEEEKELSKKRNDCKKCGHMNCGNGVYGLGLIGAAVYFLQHVANFQEGAIAVLKALLWPAFLIFELLKFLQM